MGEPALLVKEDGTRLLDVKDQQILDDIPSHRRAMMRPLLKTAEFCGACHKSQVPRELNDYKFLRAFAVADEYQMSSFSKESPHPYYVRDKETCNSCHMKREAAPLFDVSAKLGNSLLIAGRPPILQSLSFTNGPNSSTPSRSFWKTTRSV